MIEAILFGFLGEDELIDFLGGKSFFFGRRSEGGIGGGGEIGGGGGAFDGLFAIGYAYELGGVGEESLGNDWDEGGN